MLTREVSQYVDRVFLCHCRAFALFESLLLAILYRMDDDRAMPDTVASVLLAIRVLSAMAFVVIFGLAIVCASTVPDWCDSTQADAPTRCVTTR